MHGCYILAVLTWYRTGSVDGTEVGNITRMTRLEYLNICVGVFNCAFETRFARVAVDEG